MEKVDIRRPAYASTKSNRFGEESAVWVAESTDSSENGSRSARLAYTALIKYRRISTLPCLLLQLFETRLNARTAAHDGLLGRRELPGRLCLTQVEETQADCRYRK